MADQNRNSVTNKSPKISIVNDIRMMLWGLGDCQKPFLCTAKVIEAIIKKRINTLIKNADNAPKKRGSNKIHVKDLLYAMRDHKSKLSRLLEYLDLKDKLELCVGDKRIGSLPNFSSTSNQKGNFSRAAALEFLSSIGISDIDDYTRNDGIVMERKIRADRISRSLDVDDYMAFTRSRSLSFVSSSHKKKKFVEWLKSDNNKAAGRLRKNTVDVIAYLTKDTIAELIDIVLYHRKKGRINVKELQKCNEDINVAVSTLTATVDKLNTDVSPISVEEIKFASIQLFLPLQTV